MNNLQIARAALAIAASLGGGCSHTQPPVPPDRMPGLGLSLDELRAKYNHLGIGQRLKPKSWPNGARVAVALSFDMDNATVPLLRGTRGSDPMTRGMYGARDGLDRILKLLDAERVPASFFIPAVAAELDPHMIPAILSRNRHEIGIHGWIHENLVELNNEAKEQELLDKSLQVITKAVGSKPAGYRAPSWELSPFTMKQIQAAGFLYDSSLMTSDDPYEILLNGQPTGVIELPIERILDDYPYFAAEGATLPSPELVDRVYRDEFNVAYEEGGLYILTMHPSYTGHRSRALWLGRLIQYMKTKPGVWFATHEQVARYVRTAAGAE